MRAFLFVALMLGMTLPARAEPLVAPIAADVLRPSSPWTVDYAPEECRLVRTFGKDEKKIILRLARGSGINQFDLVVAGTSIPKLKVQFKGTIRLSPQAIESKIDGYSMKLPKLPERFIRSFDLDTVFFASITDNQIFDVKIGNDYAVSLLLTGGHAALEALDKCFIDLLGSWGVDVAKLGQAKVLPTPLGNPGFWVTSNDYPTEALRQELSGNVSFLLIIGKDGKPISCKIAHSSGVPMLDQQTCSLLERRAHFTPARDANGDGVAGVYLNRVRWVIPQE